MEFAAFCKFAAENNFYFKKEGKMDKIIIKDLEIFAKHGVLPEENKLGQKFLVSAVLYLDTRSAGKSDKIEDSVNYASVAHMLKTEMENKTFQLLEAVAEHLCKAILVLYSKVRKVDLEIKKPWAPIGLPLKTVSVAITRSWHEAYIGLGSNMGDREAYLAQAIMALDDIDGCVIRTPSNYFETKPYGVLDQPDFLNGVVLVDTLLSPQELLEQMQEIEAQAGRERTIHWGPRTLDLDLLLYDDEILETDTLCVPHDDIQNRRFVLEPMAEIAPYKHHPILGLTMRQLWEKWKTEHKEEQENGNK